MRRKSFVGVAGIAVVGLVILRRSHARNVHTLPSTESDVLADTLPYRSDLVTNATILAIPLVWAMTVAAWPWDTVIDAASSVAATVRKLVRDALGEVWGYIHETFDWLAHVFVYIRDTAGDVLTGLRDIAERLTIALADKVRSWIDTVYRWIDAVAGAIRQEANRTFDFVRNLINDAINIAERATEVLYGWVVDHVLNPLLHAVNVLYQWVRDHVAQVIDVLLRDVIGPIFDKLNWVWDHLHYVLDFVKYLKDQIIPVLQKCWGFLVFVATHPLSWYINYITELFHRGPDYIAEIGIRAMDSYGDQVDHTISKWLGH